MSMSRENVTDKLTNEVEAVQENTSVDPLLRKWMKDNASIAMEQDGSEEMAKSVPNTGQLKDEVLMDTNVCDDAVSYTHLTLPTNREV